MKNRNYLAPIILFTYNRPWHTRQTVEALKKNELAIQSDLIIFSDAPKNTQAEQSVQEVRDYLRTIDGFNSVKIIERNENWGLAKSIIDGVTDVVNEYGRVIVLEDDIVTSPFFLRYMNYSLEFYQNKKSVFHISGYSPPLEGKIEQHFFIYPTTCWGWATWDDRWSFFQKDIDSVIKSFTRNDIKIFNINNSYPYFSHVLLNKKNVIDTWAVFWYSSVFLNNGLSLHPRRSYTKNIGHDGSGVHCDMNSTYDLKVCNEFDISWFSSTPKVSKYATNLLSKHYKKQRKPLFLRVLGKLKR